MVKRQIIMRTEQAPRSERLRREKELIESLAAGQPGPSSVSSSIPIPSRGARSPSESTGNTLSESLASTLQPGSRPKRRMSIDPAPVSQILQAASHTNANFSSSLSSDSKPGLSSSTDAAAKSARSPPKLEVRCMVRTRIPTPHGEIFLHLYHNSLDSKEHMAIVYDPIQLHPEARLKAPRGRKEIRSRTLDAQWREGETDMERVVRGAYVGRLEAGTDGQASVPTTEAGGHDDMLDGMASIQEEEDALDVLPLVRIHSECFTGETIGSMRCDCGEQLDEAMRLISLPQSLPGTDRKMSASLPTPGPSRSVSPSSTAASTPSDYVPGRGVVIYLRQEGRGIGLLEKLRAYNLQDLGHDTVTANLMLGHGADERKYGVAAEILRDLGLADVSGKRQGGVRLLTNNPEKVEGLAQEGVSVKERVGMVPRDWKTRGHQGSPHQHSRNLDEDEGLDDVEREYGDWRDRRAGASLIGAGAARGPELEKYLRTKVERMGHRELCLSSVGVLADADSH